jgi:membrane-associated PAP2 superfamily phosphatase
MNVLMPPSAAKVTALTKKAHTLAHATLVTIWLFPVAHWLLSQLMQPIHSKRHKAEDHQLVLSKTAGKYLPSTRSLLNLELEVDHLNSLAVTRTNVILVETIVLTVLLVVLVPILKAHIPADVPLDTSEMVLTLSNTMP